jgi:hypothetical protein
MGHKDKDNRADALKRMARGDAPEDDVAPSESAPLAPPRASSRPARPSAATSKPAVPTSGKARPSMPQRSASNEQASADAPQDEISSSLANVIDDSGLSVGFEAATHGPRVSLTRAAPMRSLQLRRTLIPILLTLGVCLPLIAAWWFTLDSDAPLKEIGAAFPWALLAIGTVMLGLAVLNMLSVRAYYRTEAK